MNRNVQLVFAEQSVLRLKYQQSSEQNLIDI